MFALGPLSGTKLNMLKIILLVEVGILITDGEPWFHQLTVMAKMALCTLSSKFPKENWWFAPKEVTSTGTI